MALCAWGGREGCTRLQERDSCGGSWRPLGPATSSHAPREGKALSTRTPGAQGLHRRPGKTSPSSLPGSLDSDRVKTSRWERSKEGLSLTSGGGASSCLFPPRADLPAQPRGTGPARGSQSKAMFLKGTLLQTRRTRGENPKVLPPHAPGGYLGGLTARPSAPPPLCPARTKRKAALTAGTGQPYVPCPHPVSRGCTWARSSSQHETPPPTLLAGRSAFTRPSAAARFPPAGGGRGKH